jgi:hypothetical protein
MQTQMDPTNSNLPGALYEAAFKANNMDPFAALALHADDPNNTPRVARTQRKLCSKHCFERGAFPAWTTASNVPTMAHINMAVDMLSTQEKILRAARIWGPVSVQTWNPMAPPGSDEAKRPPTQRGTCMQFLCPKCNLTLYAVSIHSSIPNYGPVRPKTTASSVPTTPVKQTGSYQQPHVVSDDEDDDNDTMQSGPSSPGFRLTGDTASSQPYVSPTKRRQQPKGIYVSTWIKPDSTLPAVNAVYMSRETGVLKRMNRRVSKEDCMGYVPRNSGYDPKRTACKHEDIAYIRKFQNKTKEEVDALVDQISMQPQQPVVASRQVLQLGWIDATTLDDEVE